MEPVPTTVPFSSCTVTTPQEPLFWLTLQALNWKIVSLVVSGGRVPVLCPCNVARDWEASSGSHVWSRVSSRQSWIRLMRSMLYARSISAACCGSRS